MNSTIDIPILSLIYVVLLLVIPFFLSYVLNLNIIQQAFTSIFRMIIQLTLVGIFLEYVFELNNIFINLIWLGIMITVATFSIISSIKVRLQMFFIPIVSSLIISVGLMTSFINGIVLDLEKLLDAKYIIAIGGMLLGNCLRGNIIGIGHFYRNLKEQERKYLFSLGQGATKLEALMPFIRKVIEEAIKPQMAVTATMGIVSLPGMMTGQILGGAHPITAIKYQIMIMIAIFVTTMISVCLTIFFTINITFDDYGILKKESVFKRVDRI